MNGQDRCRRCPADGDERKPMLRTERLDGHRVRWIHFQDESSCFTEEHGIGSKFRCTGIQIDIESQHTAQFALWQCHLEERKEKSAFTDVVCTEQKPCADSLRHERDL